MLEFQALSIMLAQSLSERNMRDLLRYIRRLIPTSILIGVLLGQPVQAQIDTVSASTSDTSMVAVPANQIVNAAVTAPVFNSFEEAVKGLLVENLSEKQAAIEALTRFQRPQTEVILTALSEGKIYQSDGQAVIAQGDEAAKIYRTALNPEQIATVSNPKKITINNSIRQWIKNYLAENALLSADANKRKEAMKQVLDKPDAKTLAQVKSVLPNETNSEIKTLMQVYLAKADLTSTDMQIQAAAIQTLSQAADPSSQEALQSYISTVTNDKLRQQAQAAVKKIDQKLRLLKIIETLTFGLSMGSVLVLAAIGLAITFGVMGVINMAHGELMMIGAYCAYGVQQLMPHAIEWSILVAIPIAFMVSALVGVVIERTVARFLYGRPLETLLATFGVSLILQQAVRSVFSPLNRMVQTPQWMSGSWEIVSGLSITWNRVYIIVFCLTCFFALLAIMKKTRLGLEVNAVSQNRAMARAMGISDRKVDMMTFGLGSGVAGVAGVALSQITNVGPNLGQAYITDSFMVVVVGGVGNLWGTLLAGLGLGILNKVFEPWMGAVLAKAIVLVLIILFIQKYPRGLFPQKGRAVE